MFEVWNLKLASGKYYTENEMYSGSPVACIDAIVAEKIFSYINPADQTIRIQEFRFRIIGTYEKTGQDIFGSGKDETLLSFNLKKTSIEPLQLSHLSQKIKNHLIYHLY